MEQAWRAAAEKIAAADFLLVAAGAGFSADSGLPVYNDIASVAAYEALGVDYQDLCDPYWLEEDEEIFYGFWGHCFNAYRDAASHRGYEILRRWKQQLVRKRGDRRAFQRTFQQLRVSGALPASATVFPDSVTSDPFFVYTSNVDAHFHRSFGADEVYELHGSVELWQCAGVRGTGAASAPCEATWRVDPGTRFDVDTDAMRAAGGDVARCRACGGRGRPNVLMFSDRSWLPNVRDEERYVAWEAVMEQMLQEDPSLRLVVLEIGCGLRMPSVRKECEMVVADLFERCGGRGQASLIRVNPEFAHCDHPVLTANALVLSLPTTGLAALEAIDQVLTGQASS